MAKIPATLHEAAPLPLPIWVKIVVIIGALLMGAGGILALVHPAMLVSPSDMINNAARIYAGYLVARSLPLALLLVIMLSIGARRALSTLVVLTALTQALDAVMDGMEGRWALVPGVVLFSLVFLLAAARISSQPLWRVTAWRDSPNRV